MLTQEKTADTAGSGSAASINQKIDGADNTTSPPKTPIQNSNRLRAATAARSCPSCHKHYREPWGWIVDRRSLVVTPLCGQCARTCRYADDDARLQIVMAIGQREEAAV